MSLNSASSLVSDTPTEITSYDIPLQSRTVSHDLYGNLPQIETTSFTRDGIQQDGSRSQGQDQGQGRGFSINPSFDHDLEDESSDLSHGFFLGKESLQNLSVPTSDILEDDDDTEDEGISEIYRPNGDPDTWVRRSTRSFKTSPEPTPRHALSQRIGNIGIIGQNLALGHRLGVLTEDASLIPEKVKLSASHFLITEDSPVQTDVTWTKPNNASRFTSLIYKIEMRLVDCDYDLDLDNVELETWTLLADVRWPIFRIYHSDDKLFIGKVRMSRRKDDVKIEVRVWSHGELVLPDRTRHWTMSPYSKIAEVTFAGYDYHPAPAVEAQLTHL